MTKRQIKEFEAALQKELAEVEKSLGNRREDWIKRKDRTDIESGDWSQALENEEVENRIILNDEYYVEKIQKALLRIKNGIYGRCEGCGGEIPIERLRAKPSVSLCITCQEEKEK